MVSVPSTYFFRCSLAARAWEIFGCAPSAEPAQALDAGADAASMPATCPEDVDGDPLRLTAFAKVKPGEDVSYCRLFMCVGAMYVMPW